MFNKITNNYNQKYKIKKIINSPIFIVVFITSVAVIFSEILVFIQINLFWPEESHKGYYIGFWTPLIDGLILSFIALYLRKIYSEKLENEVKEKSSKLKLANKQLETLNSELEERVNEEIEKNKENQLRLAEQKKLASLGEMITNISHQWRQPLSMISTVVSGIKLDFEFNDFKKETAVAQLDKVLKTTNYLSETIDHFRDLTKEEKIFKNVILQDKLLEIINIVDNTFKDNNIETILDLNENEPLKIKTNPAELSQILINLFNNSKDALNKKSDRKWIKISIYEENQKAIISIEDNAGGIEKEILNKIFEPYFTTKHKAQGTGLGLYMSYKVLKESLNGNILVENSQNGAKFTIELPL